ncbi:hypothetical protein [Neotamlana laminarinivorans]|uniref:Uncharacterized protein n=1 Tax=Neotamlana laminarinivorans TaxID=2883124 RepID=A0A9X1L5C1_9FLAO|nr:hypothetical protein [Tamlana laminarinivorans]MCB4800324.1 hypothetical protein [Tamlana laminarinivorans]
MNKILAFSITILLFGIQKISSQDYLNYYETINKAEIANLDKEFKKSDSIYQIAFKLVEKPFKEDYLLASINSEKLNDNQKTFDYLKKGISTGLTIKRIKSQLTEFKKSKNWKILKIEYNSLRENHLKTLNLPLREEIVEMIRKDQKVRAPIIGNGKQLKKIDTYNYNRLLEIIKENNNKWPGFSIIGEITPKGKYDVTKNITLMPLHFKKEQIEKLRPYMLEAVLNGEMYPYHFARLIDYKSISNCQFYGTYKYNKKYDLGKICDCDKANQERKKIGFESIQDFYRKSESEYKCKTKK